jgi:hypothetical protein
MNKPPEFNPLIKLRDSENRSLRKHINAMCAHCMGCTLESINPGFANEIKHCTAPQCPLFAVRPYQEKVISPE